MSGDSCGCGSIKRRRYRNITERVKGRGKEKRNIERLIERNKRCWKEEMETKRFIRGDRRWARVLIFLKPRYSVHWAECFYREAALPTGDVGCSFFLPCLDHFFKLSLSLFLTFQNVSAGQPQIKTGVRLQRISYKMAPRPPYCSLSTTFC